MLELFAAHPDWAWITLGVAFILIEVLLFSAVFIWFAGAAILTGLLSMGIHMSWQTQVAVFSVLSLASLAAFKFLRGNEDSRERNDGYQLNKRATHYIGKTVEVSSEIKNGRGRVSVGDTSWKASGPDCPEGTSVKVVDVDGDRLKVEPVG